MQEKLENGYAKKSMLSMSNQARNANLTLQIKGRSDFFFSKAHDRKLIWLLLQSFS